MCTCNGLFQYGIAAIRQTLKALTITVTAACN